MIDPTNWLANKLSEYDVLSDQERTILAELPETSRDVQRGVDIVAEGTRPTRSTLLVEGFCVRYSILPDGKRQISAVHVPGDFVDLHSFLIKRMDHGVSTLGPCSIVEVPHQRLKQVTDTCPHLTRLLWLNTLVDAAIHRKWLVIMGGMDASGRLAHLISELHVRLSAVGKSANQRFVLPMTQSELAETLGLSAVHANRVLQDLRGRGLVSWIGNQIELLDLDGLHDLAMFDPAYLSIEQEPR
jgi:CRP-like cAMP-binding protein